MKLLVQWATKHARGWTEIDSSEWAALAKKPQPVGGEVIDDEPGWIHDLCVQGMCFIGTDHVAVEHLGDSVRVTSWRDDPEDYEPGEFHARVTTFHPLKPDAALGGAINTDIASVIYVGPKDWAYFKSLHLADSEIRPWDEFVPPPEEITRHGIWLPDELAEAHRESVEPPSWREWGEDGRVPSQRALGRYNKPDGTITYYMRGTLGGSGSGDDGDSYCIPGTYGYKLITSTPGLNHIVKDTVPASTTDRICFSWTTESGDPPTPWPTGDYDASVDVNNIGADVVARTRILQVKTLDCTIKETFGTSADYNKTGIQYFKLTGFDPLADTGRYQIRTIADNSSAHSQQVFWVSVRDTDSYGSGPWVGGVTHEGAATVTGSGSVSAIAGVERPGAARVSGVGAASGVGALTLPGEATATGAGSASGTATVTAEVLGEATATGVGDASGAAGLTLPGAGSATGAGTATGIPALTLPADATATGVGSASATGTVAADVLGAATATGVGITAGAATMTYVGAATVKGVGSTTAAAEVIRSGAGTATGVGSATGTATVTVDVLGAATVSGIGTASGMATLWFSAVATATGVGTASGSGTVTGGIAYWGEPCETYTGGPRRSAC